MKTKAIAILVWFAILGTAIAQKDKKWTDWNKKEAQKVLDDSPWAKTQIDTDTSEMMYKPTAGADSVSGRRSEVGAVNQSMNVTYHVRFFSARPIRQGLMRIMELNQHIDPKTSPDMVTKLHNFAEMKAGDSIIVTVTFASPDGRYSGPVLQAFSSAATAILKNDTYLQTSDGKQLFLQEYVAPGEDGFGARFIFLRNPDGQPFITDKSGEVRFYAKFPNANIKVDRRFKVADMMYEGQLEY
jgi:hypothetical protein